MAYNRPLEKPGKRPLSVSENTYPYPVLGFPEAHNDNTWVKPISVLIADDHGLVREGTKQVLEQDSALQVVAEADRGDRAVELALMLRPDIALLDLRLPGITGIEAAV